MKSEARTTILNVDDHEVSRYAVTRFLQRNNFLVLEADSGFEAMRVARSAHPDLVLLDVNLPDISGVEVCRMLKAEPATARIPVLHMTASSVTSGDTVRGLESGADSYLTEPVEPEVLLATINSVLRVRRAEEAARAMAREWRATFDAMTEGVALLDANGLVQRANESLCRLLERTRTEIEGRSCSELWGNIPGDEDPGDEHPSQAFFRALENRVRESIEIEWDPRVLSVTVDPMFEDQGQATGAVLIVSDITERRLLETQLRESQKFETVGTLAAGVAHDFNNLLTSILGNASLLLDDSPPGSRFRSQLQDVIRAGERAANLTSQLLAYAGKGRHYPEMVDLSMLIERIRKLIEAVIPKKVTLQLRLMDSPPLTEADANQMQQIILNLVSNAAEAIGDAAGVITVVTGSEQEQTVFLDVADTGCGMDAGTKARMFDPFFTTKFAGRGLGLAAVAGIARGHKASIQVTSAEGQGTAIRITFPAKARPARSGAADVAPAVAAPAATVLVVDDEDTVCRVAKTALELRGYKVLLATNGLEAICQVRNNPQISLVLLDATMPVMAGEEAVDEIMRAQPGIKIIVSTGHGHREVAIRFRDKPVSGFLQKPYTPKELAAKIQGALGLGVGGTG